LDLKFGYHQLPLKEGDKVKITFWELTPMKKIVSLMEVFVIWFEKCPCRISKDHGSNVGGS
jgi:hypothetical protein